MGARKTKRELEKAEERRLERDSSIQRRRVRKAKRRLFEAVRKVFRKGGSVHDVFFHFMLKDVAFAARFLKAYLPQKLRDALNLDDSGRIRLVSTDFYDERLKKHVADLIFVVPCKDKNEYVALTLIVEHKAQNGVTIDRKTVAQTLKYVALEVEEQLKDLPGDMIVYQPLVVLFYTGSDPNFEAPSWEESFPFPEKLRVDELQEAQVRFKPICVNLTRLFLEDKLSDEDFLRIMPEIMARASLKRLKGSYSTLFRALKSLGSVRNLTDEETERLSACINYVVQVAEQPLTKEEIESLTVSVNNEESREDMKTYFDILEERGEARGEIKGEIKGKIETITTIAMLRFHDPSRRLPKLLTKLDDLSLLDQTRQFALVASSLVDVENFAENLLQIKPKAKRVARKRVS